MRIAMVSSECEPFAKTGGLADVVDALSRALGELGHEVDVFLPRYRGIDPVSGSRRMPLDVPAAVGPDPSARATEAVDLWTGEAEGYRIRLVDHPASFDRGGIYGEAGTDYEDNAARFALLGMAALMGVAAEGQRLDILHGHDWQAGPVLLALRHGGRAGPALAHAATVLTCHTLAYHGWVPRQRTWQLGLPSDLDLGEPAGIDLLREAILAVDLVNTVSPTYALESRTPESGAGLDDALRSRADRYVGILNGIDTRVWDPATDRALPHRYDRDDPEGKRVCRADLCARHGLDPDGPVFGMVGRLDPQKGFDLVSGAAPGLLDLGARLIILGMGDATLLAELRGVAAARPDRVVILERFDRDEARRIYAGSDVFLMPSRFEPAGQGQLIALRYGSVPLARRTGGLADTVFDVDAAPERGNGFVFERPEPETLIEAAARAVARWRDADGWRTLVRRGMAEDHGWAGPARQYEAAYRTALASR